MKKGKMHRGWYISRDPFNKDRFQAVKGKERITGSAEQIIQAIDRRTLKKKKK